MILRCNITFHFDRLWLNFTPLFSFNCWFCSQAGTVFHSSPLRFSDGTELDRVVYVAVSIRCVYETRNIFSLFWFGRFVSRRTIHRKRFNQPLTESPIFETCTSRRVRVRSIARQRHYTTSVYLPRNKRRNRLLRNSTECMKYRVVLIPTVLNLGAINAFISPNILLPCNPGRRECPLKVAPRFKSHKYRRYTARR